MDAAPVPAPPDHLSPAFIAAMNDYKGGVQPWGLQQWMLDVLNDFFGGALPRPQLPALPARQSVGILSMCTSLSAVLVFTSFTEHRTSAAAADPVDVSWRPQGWVLHHLCHLSEPDRQALIREQAELSAHFNWGVDAVLFGGAVHHLRRYFTAVVELHDPRTGLPVDAWWPGDGHATGKAARRAAYAAIYKRARCMPA